MKRTLNCLLLLAVVVGTVALLSQLSPAAPAPKLPRVDRRDHDSYVQKIPDTDIKFDMIAIPGGAFLMGSPPDEKGRREDEGPQHPVAIRPFWMCKVEVTWEVFDAYRDECGVRNKETGNIEPGENEKRLEKNPDAVTGPTPPYIDETWNRGRTGYPVIGVSYHAAMELCRWLSQKTGKVYRLPTEAEWEWACRAGTTTAFSSGDDRSRLGDYACFKSNSNDTTVPVGKRKPNPWGLCDMHGNVAEWCVDHYRKDFYTSLEREKLSISPVVLPTLTRFPHVCRGGSWADPPEELRSAARRSSDKSWLKQDPCRPQSLWWLTDAETVGFRVVRAVTEQDNLKGLRSKITRRSHYAE